MILPSLSQNMFHFATSTHTSLYCCSSLPTSLTKPLSFTVHPEPPCSLKSPTRTSLLHPHPLCTQYSLSRLLIVYCSSWGFVFLIYSWLLNLVNKFLIFLNKTKQKQKLSEGKSYLVSSFYISDAAQQGYTPYLLTGAILAAPWEEANT